MVPAVDWPNARVVAPLLGDHDPLPQSELAAGVDATCMPAGNTSRNVTPVSATALVLVSVKVNVEVPLTGIGSGEKDFEMPG
jgi:hypothetical protein